MTEITATLKNATRQKWFGGKDVLIGDVHGDSKGRFEDGERIHTSVIVRELPGDVFVTKNSTYKVDSWAKEADGGQHD